MNPTRRITLALVFSLALLPGIAQNVFAQTRLVVAGSKWKFLADGTDQGTAWRAPGFDDTKWIEGPAKLGFGDDNVTTVIAAPAAAETKVTTTYFRHVFTAVDAATMNNFLIRLMRDDGAVVYLNGVEVFRSNMPEGDVSFATLASSAIGGSDETEFVSKFFKENHVKEGRNVLAVEVHQSDSTSSDLGFDLELLARYTLVPPTVAITAPTAADTVVEGPIVVTVDAAFVGGEITKVTLLEGETVIGEVTSSPFEFSWVAAAGSHTLTARATTTEGLDNTSIPLVLNVLPTLIRQGAVWKYLADGTNQGKSWRDPGFNDASWSEGPAQLGYGDGDEKTTVPSGADSTTNFITTYFRTSFTVTDTSTVKDIEGLLTYDDGAVVYLNGMEVFRINMPIGDPAFNAPATSGTDYEPEKFSVLPKFLRAGVNVIAVEVHQASTTSSDVSFDLMLRATSGTAPAVGSSIR